MNVIKKTIKGMGYLNGYGYHPGASFISIVTIAAVVETILGRPEFILFMSPLYFAFLYGSYGRTTEWEKRQENKRK